MRQFFHLTLPQLRYILPLDMYLTGFRGDNMGAASVLAVLLVGTGLALALGLSRLSSFSKGSRLEGA